MLYDNCCGSHVTCLLHARMHAMQHEPVVVVEHGATTHSNSAHAGRTECAVRVHACLLVRANATQVPFMLHGGVLYQNSCISNFVRSGSGCTEIVLLSTYL
jgi:hypothetical protein